ncbi:MAG TPA: cytidine deaminase [Chthoniobacteraceae bacterium]|jgi:cytidine deaminase|nr:cytidine deaminase [Chthoniobacteraceae bacterium]
MDFEELIQRARAVRDHAYAPYSRFTVGAAVLSSSGRVFTGCNVENLSFGLTICAERNAVFAAVAAGERRFTRMAVVADSKSPVTPCGACRQVLAEFGLELEVCSANLAGETYKATLNQLLPRASEGILGT